jgi:hypothetical protein
VNPVNGTASAAAPLVWSMLRLMKVSMITYADIRGLHSFDDACLNRMTLERAAWLHPCNMPMPGERILS